MAKAPVLTTFRGRFVLQPGETLLAALERTGHKVEYQCRHGYCGACRLTLLGAEPEALYYPEPPLASLRPGEVLPCCCTARGNIELQLPAEAAAATSPQSSPLSAAAPQWP